MDNPNGENEPRILVIKKSPTEEFEFFLRVDSIGNQVVKHTRT